MEDSGPGIRPVENETRSEASRTTREGRKFTYRLNVIQQPQRARACGSGAKSSADRRPVDPPPIVELKIHDQNDIDVTFSMNANYFLFTTLESARVIAQARNMPAHDVKNSPMLTGTPVAGMVCLDRPTPAGYFIFPDLSVRNEGMYRLSFSLYEELKDPKDEDQVETVPKPEGSSDTCVTHRLEVKSVPFQVYSAKKFPGLTESTTLSRTVAEQGCRVRIRRDVRMRKRDSKGGKGWDGYEDQTSEARARLSATPEASGYGGMHTPHGYGDPIPRPRSGSHASHHSLAPSLSLSRRPSLQEINQGYHAPSYGTAPQTPSGSFPQTSPYGPSPGQSYPQASFTQQQPAMQPPPPQYAPQSFSAPQQAQSYQQNQPQSTQQGYYGIGNNGPVPPPMYPTNFHSAPAPPVTAPYEHHGHTPRTSIDHPSPMTQDARRASSQYSLPPASAYGYPRQEPPQVSGYQSTYQPQPQPHTSQTNMYPTQATQQSSAGNLESYSQKPGRPEPVQPPTRTTGAVTPFPSTGFAGQLPPLNIPQMQPKALEPSSPVSATPYSGYYSASVSGQSDPLGKRSYGSVFSERQLNQPLRYGARPSTEGHFYPNAEVDDNEPEQPLFNAETMKYRRSDGRHMERPLQPQN